MTNRLTRVLGSDTLRATDDELRYRHEADVICSVETSPSGNTVLAIGTQPVGDNLWYSGKAHVVLTDKERDELLAVLLGDRATARIFQALAQETDRLEALDREDRWRDTDSTNFCRELRDRFAAVHPEPDDAVVPTHTHTTTAAGELLDADGSHCVRCTCTQCTEPDD